MPGLKPKRYTNDMAHGHYRADVRNLRLHRAALEKLRHHPELRQACLDLVGRWLQQPEQAPAREYLERWREMLGEWDVGDMERLVLERHEGQALRQSSPLGPALSPRERWAVLREVNEELMAADAE